MKNYNIEKYIITDNHNHKIIYDSYKIEEKPELQEFLESKKLVKILENMKEDVIMVLGWDGTMLKAIRKYYKQEKAFLPINYGSRWFLLNNKNFVNKKSEFIEREYPLIDIKVESENKKFNDVAFNEIIVKDRAWKMVNLDIIIASENHLELKWDWLILSTPAGSTWSNFSNYWPLLPHSSNSFVITYLWSYSPKRNPPSIIENDDIIQIKNKWRINSILINADWNKILTTIKDQEVNITIKKSKYKVKLLIEKSYKKDWDNKVLEEQGFNN